MNRIYPLSMLRRHQRHDANLRRWPITTATGRRKHAAILAEMDRLALFEIAVRQAIGSLWSL